MEYKTERSFHSYLDNKSCYCICIVMIDSGGIVLLFIIIIIFFFFTAPFEIGIFN